MHQHLLTNKCRDKANVVEVKTQPREILYVVERKLEAAERGNNKQFETGFLMGLWLGEDEENCQKRGKEGRVEGKDKNR